jgi:tetraacyldisaccharide 4'-kinase
VKAALERWLHRRWYGELPPGLGLRALAGLYRVLSSGGRPVPERLAVPVIVVGNFTAGGTGKTPLVIALARYFKAQGYQPAIVSRGHGRKSRRPIRVSADTDASECGDEPKLMFERTGLPVFVDGDRSAAARRAIADDCDLVISDDGLQHHGLARDLEIEVVDGERGYGNGLLIPAGPLRERPRPCDLRVVTGKGARPDDWSMQLRLGDAVPVHGELSSASLHARGLAEFAGSPVHAVAGIGNPGRFFEALRAFGLSVVEHAFEDHHVYVPGDFAGLDGHVLMTEKDAVKCRGLGLASAWAVPAEANLAPEFYAAVRARLERAHAG